MSMMPGLFVIATGVMFGGFVMVLGGMLMVLGGMAVVLGGFLCV
jgi:hypothetical protein